MNALAQSEPVVMLKLSEVRKRVNLGSTTIYRKMGTGNFPRPVNMGSGTVRWYEHEINEYLLGLPRAKGS